MTMISPILVQARQFNPEMLVLAREARWLTQSELAKQASLPQAEVSRYENGTRQPSEEHILTLTRVLKYSRTLFFQNDQPYGLGSNGLYHRKQRSLAVKDLNALIAQINLLRFFVNRLLKSMDIDLFQGMPQYDPIEFNGDIETIAEMVRAAWKLPSGPVHDLVGVLENAGCIIHKTNFGTRKLDALTQYNPPTPPIIIINEDAPGDRVRFTLAHELGHLVMHNKKPSGSIEEEANAFASAFLMPQRDIMADLKHASLSKLVQLKPYWRVSIASLIRRSYDLTMITEREYKALNTELSAYDYRQSEPIPIAQEKPTLLQEIIQAHIHELGYSVADVAELAMLDEQEFVHEYLERMQKLRLVPKM